MKYPHIMKVDIFLALLLIVYLPPDVAIMKYSVRA